MLKDMLPLLIPVVFIEVTLLIIALMDMVKREYVRGGKSYWLALGITVVITIASIWSAQRWLRYKDF